MAVVAPWGRVFSPSFAVSAILIAQECAAIYTLVGLLPVIQTPILAIDRVSSRHQAFARSQCDREPRSIQLLCRAPSCTKPHCLCSQQWSLSILCIYEWYMAPSLISLFRCLSWHERTPLRDRVQKHRRIINSCPSCDCMSQAPKLVVAFFS